MTTRREWNTAATQHISMAQADALWALLGTQPQPVHSQTILNAALEIGVAPHKAEDLARAVASSQQTVGAVPA